MRLQGKQPLLLFLSAILVSSCATHWKYASPCLTNPDGDYKDLVTIAGKAKCFSGDSIIEQPITKAITKVPMPARIPVVAIYKFEDLTGQRNQEMA